MAKVDGRGRGMGDFEEIKGSHDAALFGFSD
jgi:hypothetical protein